MGCRFRQTAWKHTVGFIYQRLKGAGDNVPIRVSHDPDAQHKTSGSTAFLVKRRANECGVWWRQRLRSRFTVLLPSLASFPGSARQ